MIQYRVRFKLPPDGPGGSEGTLAERFEENPVLEPAVATGEDRAVDDVIQFFGSEGEPGLQVHAPQVEGIYRRTEPVEGEDWHGHEWVLEWGTGDKTIAEADDHTEEHTGQLP